MHTKLLSNGLMVVHWKDETLVLFFNGPNPASFCLFLFFSHEKYSTKLTINGKRIDGVLGT